MRSELRIEVEEFQAKETRLLQTGSYDQWLELFTDDLCYSMPIVPVRDTRSETKPRLGDLAYFDDTLETLRLRVERTKSRFAWTEIPPSRVRYFTQITNISPESESVGDIQVVSNVLIYQTRLELDETLFIGERLDVLRRVTGELKIASRTVTLDRSVVPGKNLSIFF
jgi:3-phenylpropionate/cinnamic acid dioxygenase small subunit